MNHKHLVPVLVLAALAGCNGDATSPTSNPTGNLRFVSGVHGSVNVLVDGTPVLSNVTLGGYVGVDVAAGQHSISLQKVGGATTAARLVTFASNVTAVMVGTDSSGAARLNILLDTNAVVPAGATKLRVGHFAASASIDIWRTQPDYQTPIRVMFPFNYNDVSPYLQSTVGDWRVMASHPIAGCCGSMPDTLANTGTIAVADGKSRTVIFTDGVTVGTVQVVVIDP